jgi:sec-independent protein translocase protein TatC
MKVLSYITEIKNRVLITTWTLLTNMAVLVKYNEELYFLLARHQENTIPYFITTNLPEIFVSLIKISLFLSLYFSFITIIIQIWLFILPGLYQNEYKTMKTLIIQSVILYTLGTLTVYKVFVPYCWDFFTGFELKTEETILKIHLETRLNEYLNFFIKISVSLTVLFQGIILIILLIKNIRATLLTKYRKLFYVFLFTIATMFTPPDVFSQITVGLFLISSFELFLLTVYITNAYKGE